MYICIYVYIYSYVYVYRSAIAITYSCNACLLSGFVRFFLLCLGLDFLAFLPGAFEVEWASGSLRVCLEQFK